MKKDTGVATRVLNLLSLFCEEPAILSLKDIAARTGLPPSSVHRLLQPLLEAGAVERAPGRCYRVGAELVRMGALLGERLPLLETARPIMREMVRESAHPCFLSLYLPKKNARMVIACEPTPGSETYLRIHVHECFPLVWGASGRAILAHLPHHQIDRVLDDAPPSPLTGGPLPDRRRTLALLDDIRAKGYAAAEGQIRAHDKVSLASPVFSPDRKILGNLSLTVLRDRWSDDEERRLSRLLIERSHTLARQLERPAA